MAMKPLARCREVKEKRRNMKEIISRCHGNKARAYDCRSASSPERVPLRGTREQLTLSGSLKLPMFATFKSNSSLSGRQLFYVRKERKGTS